jgi:hypothetical protein
MVALMGGYNGSGRSDVTIHGRELARETVMGVTARETKPG